MSESPLVSKIIPRRRAASRASAAMQPESSSESEREDDPEWGAGKAKAGPLRKRIAKGHSTGNIMEREQDVDMERTRSSPIKKYSVKRQRRAAAQAANWDSTASEDVGQSNGKRKESVSSPPRPRPKPKPNVKVSRTMPAKNKSAKPKPTVDTLLDLSALGDDEESDLTPLSSPVDLPEPAAPSAIPVTPSRPVRSHPMFGAAVEVLKGEEASALEKHIWEADGVEDAWRPDKLGRQVYVRLDGKDAGNANVFDPQNFESGKETLWWPARVVSTPDSSSTIKVRLYGDAWRTLFVHKPCRENIRSRLIRGIVRFASYEDALQPSTRSASPKKKAKPGGHNKLAWEKAIEAQAEYIAKKDTLDVDELPPSTLLLSASVRKRDGQQGLDIPIGTIRGKGRIASRPRKGKRKRQATPETEDAKEPEYVEGLVNVNDLHDLAPLDVGEGVLAREKRGTSYWPAKILEYYPSSKWGEEAKYKVLYLDNKEAVVPRSYIAHQDSDDFVTCKLGQVESAVVDDTVDADDEQEPDDLRSQSPSPQNPSPARDRFNQLSIREQFVYVKPVLEAILRNEYGPMKDKVDRFLSNDKAFLAGLAKNSANEGLMDPIQVNVLVAYLKWWCLRGESGPQSELEVGDAGDLGDVDSALSDAPESVATEPIPSAAPSSPAASERTVSPVAELPPSSFAAPAGASQSTVKEKQREENGSDRMDTREDGAEEIAHSDFSPRPTGSVAYEGLTAWQRLDFCLNILKQEAIRQILLWRRGERTSTELLSEEEEQRLYEKGQELLEEQDWIADILRLRRKAEARDKLKQEMKDKTVSARGRVMKKTNYVESD